MKVFISAMGVCGGGGGGLEKPHHACSGLIGAGTMN